jgi:hypothetical protein
MAGLDQHYRQGMNDLLTVLEFAAAAFNERLNRPV